MIATLVTLAMMLPDPAWRVVEHAPDEIWAVDANSIRTEGSSRLFWQIGTSKADKGDGTHYSLTRWRASCDSDELEITNIVDYRQDGTQIKNLRVDAGVDPVVPGTFGSAMLAAVCQGEWKYDHEPYADTSEFVETAQTYFDEPNE